MIKIYTLGDFDIRYGEQSILEKGGYPHKSLKLFKFMLTFRERKLLPENVIEELWNESDFREPKNVLRTQISRLRKMFYLEDERLDQFFTIENIGGYYLFKLKDNCVLDIDLFEKLVNQGISLSEEDPERALSVLKEGIDLYKGDYLSDLEYDEWIIPIRNRFHRLFLKALYTYIKILKKKNMFKDIVNICESTIQFDPYGEVLHIYFMESLLKIGEKRYALSHYEFITSRIYNNLGIAPSSKMREFYKRMQSYDEDPHRTIDIRGLDEELEYDTNKSGALICEPFHFKFLYNLEKRKRGSEKGKKVFLGLITIEDRGSIPISQVKLNEIMDKSIDIIDLNLRKGDVLSKWNENQIVSLHYELQEKDLDIIVDRLNKKLQEQINNKNIEFLIKFRHV